MVGFCHHHAAACTKDGFAMAAVAANVHAHVFDNTQYRHIHFLEHAQAALGIDQGDVLRRGDDNRAASFDYSCHL